LIAALDEASPSRFHLRAVLVSGMGFFTDAYDLFVIGTASTLIAKDWGLSSGQLGLLNSTMLGAAFLGAWRTSSPSATSWASRCWRTRPCTRGRSPQK
jgi:MFS family permease